MIKLNTNNGDLTIANYHISSDLKAYNLETFDNNSEIEVGVINGDYKSFKLLNVENGELSLVFYFFREHLTFVDITLGTMHTSAPFLVTEEQKRYLKQILNYLGGEKLYSWGRVEFSEDQKGGLISIVIRYLN